MWEDFVLFVAVGFAAQMVDGAVGMAYGLSATSVPLSFGVPPATASASVHAAEVFTTGISGAPLMLLVGAIIMLLGSGGCCTRSAEPLIPGTTQTFTFVVGKILLRSSAAYP